MFKRNLYAIFLLFISISLTYSQGQPDPFDYGRMWTFENPPYEYLEETYDWEPDEEWMERARKSSLRFSSFCSASFVSPNGLIMTNHHCSGGVINPLEQDGEDFDKEGFYAEELEDERQAPGLFVEQLIHIFDVTEEVKETGEDREDITEKRDAESRKLQELVEKYQEEYPDLRIQPVIYYSGGRYSIYAYKRYDDIRLVMIPEAAVGYFGGDPDNFTYPRYSLDFTFWRAYENGEPADTEDHYYQFNTEDLEEDTPVFVIGNPGQTERYRTISQLKYDRDYRFPMQLYALQNYYDLLKEEYERNPNPDLKDQIFSLSNSIKAYTGIVRGLETEEYMARKRAMEDKIRRSARTNEVPDYWKELDAHYTVLSDRLDELQLLSPSAFSPASVRIAHQLHEYIQLRETGEEAEDIKESILSLVQEMKKPVERKKLIIFFRSIEKFAQKGDPYRQTLLRGTPERTAEWFLDETEFTDEDEAEDLLEKKVKKLKKKDDPVVIMAQTIVKPYEQAAELFQTTSPERKGLEEKIMNEVFRVYGEDLPPDATFTLRFADGRVKGFDYNGTRAPWKTSYFGMYDRHYSHENEEAWTLPERWEEPSLEFLKSPLNFVSTNDIIGGNSGSAVINKDQEAVGLIFDGNIESLPGNFIFDEERNRSVSVHVGGITAALRYIYNAERLLEELLYR